MFEKLLQFIFAVIQYLANFILTPIFNLLTSVIPNFNQFLSALDTVITTATEGAIFIINFLCLPLGAISMFFSFILAYGTFIVALRIIKLIYNIYHKLKPT